MVMKLKIRLHPTAKVPFSLQQFVYGLRILFLEKKALVKKFSWWESLCHFSVKSISYALEKVCALERSFEYFMLIYFLLTLCFVHNLPYNLVVICL